MHAHICIFLWKCVCIIRFVYKNIAHQPLVSKSKQFDHLFKMANIQWHSTSNVCFFVIFFFSIASFARWIRTFAWSISHQCLMEMSWRDNCFFYELIPSTQWISFFFSFFNHGIIINQQNYTSIMIFFCIQSHISVKKTNY